MAIVRFGNHAPQPVHALLVKHGLQFCRWPGQQNHQFAMLTVNRIQPLPGRAAAAVFENHRTVQHIRLAGVVVGHLDPPGSKARVECADDVRIAAQANTQRFRHRLPRQIVFRGAQATHRDHDVGASQGNANRVGEIDQPVANDRFEGDIHAQLQQPVGEEEGVCILTVGS